MTIVLCFIVFGGVKMINRVAPAFLIPVLFSLVCIYVGILLEKAGDWGDGSKSAYFQLALRSLRSLGANQVHPMNWYPIPLVFCRPWGKLPENVPCHPKLADFANCMKKKVEE